MYVTKEFDYRFAFIRPEADLSDIKTTTEEKYNVNTTLSKVIPYFFGMLSDIVSKFEVEESLQPIIKKYFPPTRVLNPDSSVDGAKMVSVVSLDSNNEKSRKRTEGPLMLPMFVDYNSQVLYNIHLCDNEDGRLTKPASWKYNTAQANFFHRIIRSKTSTNTRVIWKDPVCNDSKMREESYDESFLLYLTDKYLRYTWKDYPEEKEKALAACMVFSEDLKSSCVNIKVKTVRAFDDEMSSTIFLPGNCKDVNMKDAALTVDEVKSNLVDTLYFLIVTGAKDLKNVVLIVAGYTPESNYKHLPEVSKRFPDIEIEIWDRNSDLNQGKIVTVKKVLTRKALDEYKSKELFVISRLTTNDHIFKTEFKGRLMLTVSKTLLDPFLDKKIPGMSFLSVFTDKYKPRGQIIIAGGLEEGLHKDALALVKSEPSMDNDKKASRSRDVNNYHSWLINNYRDKNLWMYSVEGSNKEFSYDEAILKTIYLMLKK